MVREAQRSAAKAKASASPAASSLQPLDPVLQVEAVHEYIRGALVLQSCLDGVQRFSLQAVADAGQCFTAKQLPQLLCCESPAVLPQQ